MLIHFFAEEHIKRDEKLFKSSLYMTIEPSLDTKLCGALFMGEFLD
jgi:hypothetical protein